MGIFVRYFLWRGRGYIFSLNMTTVWDLANGAGILAPSDAIDQSVLIGGDGDSSSTAGSKAQGPRPPSR